MYIKNVLSLSGMPGLYSLVSNRSNGLIVENIVDRKRSFASTRRHQFSPLETIGIYTEEDTVEIKVVLERMHSQSVTLPVPENKASKGEMETYFKTVVPEYDPDQVSIADIKKVIKWYKTLVQAGYHEKSEEEE